MKQSSAKKVIEEMSKDLTQAVVIIHGMGEQKPMDTLRSFVDAIWINDPDVKKQTADKDSIFSSPDYVSRSFELRRLITKKGKTEWVTHFYEFYWAHLMKSNSITHLFDWFRFLMWRRPCKVPRNLLLHYFILWLVLIFHVALIYLAIFLGEILPRFLSATIMATIVVTVMLITLPFLFRWLKNVLGDAARYFLPTPANVQRRQEIREAGVSLLKTLHKEGYDRIVIVGHSLGSVIGYDILTQAWINYNDGFKLKAITSTKELENLENITRGLKEKPGPNGEKNNTDGIQQVLKENPYPNGAKIEIDSIRQALKEDPDGEEYQSAIEGIQQAQRDYFDELRQIGSEWRVTDFITLGCPLTHAKTLLAREGSEFERKKLDGEMPQCPPVLIEEDGEDRFSYKRKDPNGKKVEPYLPSNAAVFGPTQWTNLYFPVKNLLWGDFIAGPLREVLGYGVRDVPVYKDDKKHIGFFSHTRYWKLPKNYRDDSPLPYLRELRLAIDIANNRAIQDEERRGKGITTEQNIPE